MIEPCVSWQEHRRVLIMIVSDAQEFFHKIESAMLVYEALKGVQEYVNEQFDGLTLQQFSHVFDQKNILISDEDKKVVLDEEGKKKLFLSVS